ncbi:MAG TPA: cytochrome c peroxidase [Polyangia bacterium]|jgi:cytochrome c peroxidase|nr:cytochrome c peroxidase [Polyangia bacterium]
MFVIAPLLGCAMAPSPTPAPPPRNDFVAPQMIAESVSPQDPNRVALGRLLFHDPRLSKNRQVSCNSCHVLTRFGIDGKATSTVWGAQSGRRNVPSIFNAATHLAQFWDGRALTVEMQAGEAMTNPIEMAMPNEAAVVEAISRVPRYVEMFQTTFPGDDQPISVRNVGEAIGAFERGLATTSRWDKFIAGDHAALSSQEKRGLDVFMQRGCIACHAGPQVGGTSLQKVGAVFPWPNQADKGRLEVTRFEPDRMVFKVPSLKNVTETGPYFHDGSTSSLEVAIRLMAFHQLGLEITEAEVYAIADWMRSMTGEPDPRYIAAPELPPGG